MKTVSTILRVVLGLIFVIFGINYYLHFIPIQMPMDGPIGAFMGGLSAAPYMWHVVKATEIIGGLLLLSGSYVPLALTILFPITLNIFLFHTTMTPIGDAIMAIAMMIFHVILFFSFKASFAGVLDGKNVWKR
jgi:putative oxidoreductase